MLWSEQKKEIQDEARRVEVLLDEYNSLWTGHSWPSARKTPGLSKKSNEVKDVQTTSSSMSPTSDSYQQSRPNPQDLRLTEGKPTNSPFAYQPL